MTNGDFKDITRGIASNKMLRDKKFFIPKNSKCDGCQRSPGSMVYKLFNNKTSGEAIKKENVSNKELVEKLHN